MLWVPKKLKVFTFDFILLTCGKYSLLFNVLLVLLQLPFMFGYFPIIDIVATGILLGATASAGYCHCVHTLRMLQRWGSILLLHIDMLTTFWDVYIADILILIKFWYCWYVILLIYWYWWSICPATSWCFEVIVLPHMNHVDLHADSICVIACWFWWDKLW